MAPSEKSELTDQLLFGDYFRILERKKDWSFIKSEFDGYNGWINNSNHIIALSEEEFNQGLESSKFVVNQPFLRVSRKNEQLPFHIPGGSLLSYWDKNSSAFQNGKEIFSAESLSIKEDETRAGLIHYANQYLGAPYLWGGKSIFGIDCSGFTQIIFKMAGISLKRDSSEQVEQGSPVNFLAESKKGDLAFFDNDEGKITHVGIIMEDGKIIHASGRVRTDKLDHQGIYNEEEKRYTHKLRVIKNMTD
jgi:cell wall-associated NlpC family hydrolase